MESTNVYLSFKDWITVNMPQLPFYVLVFALLFVVILWIAHKIKIKKMENELNSHVRNSSNIKYCAACRVFMEKISEEAVYGELTETYQYTIKKYECPKCKDTRRVNVT